MTRGREGAFLGDVMKSVAKWVAKIQALADLVFMVSGLGDKAFAKLRWQIVHDPDLLSQAVDVAVVTSLRAARLSLRADIKAGMEADGRRFLFSDWPLMDGVTRLAKATREQLLDDAERYRAMAKGNERSRRYLCAVALRLEWGQAVHEVLAEADLVQLWEKSGDI